MTLMSGGEETNRASFQLLARKRSEISGEALERERADVAAAATVRQEGVVASRIAGSNVDDDSKSDSENGSKKLILQADFYAKGFVTADGIFTKSHWKAVALDQFLLKTQPLVRALEMAVAQETAVVANEKAGANPEAAVPEGKVGMARVDPKEARAILGKKTFGEKGTEAAGAATVRQEGVVASRIAGSNGDDDIKSDSENGSKELILKLPLPGPSNSFTGEEEHRQQEAPKQYLKTGERREAGTGEVEEWSTEEAIN